jgi:hypothetical protein
MTRDPHFSPAPGVQSLAQSLAPLRLETPILLFALAEAMCVVLRVDWCRWKKGGCVLRVVILPHHTTKNLFAVETRVK